MATPVVNPGGFTQFGRGVRQPAVKPYTVRSAARPANPAGGGHYVKLPGAGNQWQQIHATGPQQWAPGPPKAKPAPKAAPRAAANPFTVAASSRPANPDTGGHYVKTARGRYQLIHATGKGQWKPGPPPKYSQPLYQPAGPVVSGQPLANLAHQLTDIQYDPAIRQLTQQIAQNAQQGAGAQKATAGYFDQLGQYAQQSARDVQNTGTGLNAQLAQIGQGTQSALDRFGQQAATPAVASLAAQGFGGGAADQLAAQIAGLKGTAATQSAADQAYGAKVGANAATLAGENVGTYALRGQERLGQIAAATRLAAQPTETQLATQRVDKAKAYGTNLAAARQQQFQNLVATQGLGLKADAITSAARTAGANRKARARSAAAALAERKRESDRTFGLDKRKFGRAVANDMYDRRHGLGKYAPKTARGRGGGGGGGGGGAGAGGGKPLTAAGNSAYWAKISSGIAAVGLGRQQGKSNRQIYNELLTRLNGEQAQAAMDLWNYHYLSPSTARQLHRAGARGGTYLGRPVRVGAPPGAAPRVRATTGPTRPVTAGDLRAAGF